MDDVIVSDLDGTLTIDDRGVAYEARAENSAMVLAVRNARSAGYKLVIATSRNMRTYEGDVDKIRQFTQPLVERWLEWKGIAYDGLVVGKPWCGPRGFYVDDRNLHVEEFVFRFTCPYAPLSIDVVTLAHRLDAAELCELHLRNRRLERLFNIQAYRYPMSRPHECQAAEAMSWRRDDPKVEVLPLEANTGDGAALRAAVRQCTADMVLVISPGNAYNPLLFFQRHAERLQGEVDAMNVFACPVETTTWRNRLSNWRRAARKADTIRPNTIALVDRELLYDRLQSPALDELLASGMQAIGPAKNNLFLPELAPISPSGESGVRQRALGAVRRWLFHEHTSKRHSPQQHLPQQQVAPHRENHVRV